MRLCTGAVLLGMLAQAAAFTQCVQTVSPKLQHGVLRPPHQHSSGRPLLRWQNKPGKTGGRNGRSRAALAMSTETSRETGVAKVERLNKGRWEARLESLEKQAIADFQTAIREFSTAGVRRLYVLSSVQNLHACCRPDAASVRRRFKTQLTLCHVFQAG